MLKEDADGLCAGHGSKGRKRACVRVHVPMDAPARFKFPLADSRNWLLSSDHPTCDDPERALLSHSVGLTWRQNPHSTKSLEDLPL